ncbi:MAG: hypothetical protein MJ105_00155 [Lachnospiraceae bacterium]|nr:hypothetical protein [Lachnospiraceae bacterium]
MVIASHVDLEQFKENGQWTDISNQKLRSYADSYFSAMAEVRPALFAGICAMKGRINEKISERSRAAYEEIIKLVRGEEYENLAQYDYELKVFTTAVKIYETEKMADACIFDSIEFTEHFETIYRKMNFYFRRMQLGLAKPLQEEAMGYIAEKKISVYAVEQLVLDSTVGEKDRIFEVLATLYAERLGYKEALYLVNLILGKETTGDAERKRLVAMAEEMQLKLRVAKGV